MTSASIHEPLDTQAAEPSVSAVPADMEQNCLMSPASPENQEAGDFAVLLSLAWKSFMTSHNELKR